MGSIFKRIFQKRQTAASETTSAEILSGGINVFTAWSGDAYANDIYRGAVDSIARNAAKLKGSHVIKHQDNTRTEGDHKLNRLLQIESNPYMSAFDTLYKLVTLYFLYNNAFAFLQKDDRGNMTGIYPLNPLHVEFKSDPAGVLYCRFLFTGGKEVTLPYDDIIHLRRNFNANDLLGDSNAAILPTLQLAHTQNEGITAAIKNSAHIRGIIKTPVIMNNDALKKQRDLFVKDYLNVSNNGGVLALAAQFDYTPIEHSPHPIDEKQLETVKTKIYDYLGVSESIVSSSYTEDQWAAFYESTIEPIALQLSLEFTRKVFNDRERAFGNAIQFESGRFQFSSSATKIRLIKELMGYGLLTINQALEILNLPSVEDGDKRLTTLNVVNAELADKYQLTKAGLKFNKEDGEDFDDKKTP